MSESATPVGISQRTRLRVAAVVGLLVAGFLIQVHFLRTYPQAPLFGDAAAYHQVGERLREACARWVGGESFGGAIASVRGVLYFAGVGSFYAALETLRPGDLGFGRLVSAGFNTGSLLAAFLIARRISGFRGGLAALVLGLLYPSFSTQTGRLLPDPVTGFFFTWAALLLAEAIFRKSSRWMAAAGFSLTLGLFIRSQLMSLTMGFLGLALLLASPLWVRRRESRRLVAGLAAGCAPLLLLWGTILVTVRGETREIEQLGNFTFGGSYPYGFWQFLDSDGWIGPYRLKTEPYYRALEQAMPAEPELLRSRSRQLRFTAGYVASRPVESLLLVLDNVYRQHARPANDYKWDYPIPYRAQVALQGASVVLGLCGLVVVAVETPALAGVFLMPFVIAVIHGLAYPWPRFNQPVMPIWIALAGVFVGFASGRARGPARRALLRGLALTVVLALVAVGLGSPLPAAARVACWAATLALLGIPCFIVSIALGTRAAQRAALMAFMVLASTTTAHAIRDRRWHETELVLGGEWPAVEQQIRLTPEALAALKTASEAKLVFDLTVPGGDVRGLSLEIQGRSFAGTALEPTIPSLRESISIGGRERRVYPQWWAIPLEPEMLPRSADEPLRVVLRVTTPGVRVRGDRFTAQDRLYEGPSFGDWPNLSAVKLEYDGDYRLPIRSPLSSRGATSTAIHASGRREELRSVLRVRAVTLAANEGSLLWETESAPKATHAVFGFAAVSGNRGQAELRIDGRPTFTFPLGAERDYSIEQDAFRLCHVFEGIKQEKASGVYLVSMPVSEPGRPISLELRFRTGMSVEAMFFVLDKKRDPKQLEPHLAGCGFEGQPFVNGLGRLIDATRNNYPEDFGRWRAALVF